MTMTRKIINKFNIVLAAVVAFSMILAPVKAMAKGSVVEDKLGTTTLSWEKITAEEGAKAIIDQGRIVEFPKVPCKIWIPNTMQPISLGDADAIGGFVGYYTTADNQNIASIVHINVGGMSLSDYKTAVTSYDGVYGVTDITVNGVNGVLYNMKSNNATCVSFIDDNGYVLEFTFSSMTDEAYKSMVAYMIASITK